MTMWRSKASDFLWGCVGGCIVALLLQLCGGCSFDVERGTGADLAPDAGAISPDAAPTFVTLRPTDDGVIEPSAGARCQASPPFGATGDQSWIRVFDLPSEGIVGSFALTDVHLRLAYARDAHGVQVKIGTYTGAYGAASLSMGQVTWMATSTIDMPDAGGPFDVNLGGAMAVVTLPAGARLVVGVFAPSYLTTGGALRLGFTNAAEHAPSYFASSSCGVSPPASTEAIGAPGHLVLEVSGWSTP